MSDVREHNGQQYVLSGTGYRRITPEEAEILSGDYRSVAIKSALSDIGAAMGMMGKVGYSALPGETADFMADTMGYLGGLSAQEGQPIRSVRSETAIGGEVLTEAGFSLIGGGMAKLFAPRRAGSLVDDVQRGIARNMDDAAPLPAATPPPGSGFGASSAGAAATGEKVRGMGKLFRWVTDHLDDPRSLSADQFEILQTRLWDDVGFEFPPGSLNAEGLYATFLSNPITHATIAPYLARNSRKLGERFIKAVGLDPADFPQGFGRGVQAAAKERFRGLFNGFADQIDSADLSGIADDLAPFMRREMRQKLQTGSGTVTGRDLFNIRSTIRAAQDRVWKNPDEAAIVLLDDLSEQLDDIIEAGLGSDQVAKWARVREQYRTFKVLERPGVIAADSGDLSLKSLALQLQKQYDEMALLSPEDLSKAQFLNPETGELLKFARVARSFADSIADSGTATRSMSQALAEGGVSAAGRFTILRHALEQGALTPEDALFLAQ